MYLIIFECFVIFMIFQYFLFNKTPLIVASDIGETEIVRLLLEMPGINVNHKDIFN